MTRRLGRKPGPLRVAIADDSGLIFSDDWRSGWEAGFSGIGCEIRLFDIAALRRHVGRTPNSPYSTAGARGLPKLTGETIARWEPDLLFAHHGLAASHKMFLAEFKKKGIKTACYLCDEPYETGMTAGYSPLFDHVFTMDPCTIEAHRMSRHDRSNVCYLPSAVEPAKFPLNEKEREIPALFLGNASLVPRVRYLEPVERVVEGAQIRYWNSTGKGHKNWIPLSKYPTMYANSIIGLNVHRDPVITMECYKRKVLGRSPSEPVPAGLTLCDGPPAAEGTGIKNDGNLPAAHINPRFFEMASTGACVVSDNHRSELARLFPFVPQAESPEHFLELVLYFLEHTDEAFEIGRACSFLISSRHTYRHRAAEILIRVGLTGLLSEGELSCLGAQEDWLTPQDWMPRGERSPSGRTGPSERRSPA